MISEFVFSALVSCKYIGKNQIHREVIQVLKKWPTLSPLKELFVFNNGESDWLLGFKGTIPIIYKGSQYNIPLVIWIHRNHPQSIPYIFLLPTVEMRIRVSKYVNRNGEVVLPITPPIRFSLETLVNLLTSIFQDNPPLYVKIRKTSM